MRPTAEGTITNTATVTSSTADADQTDNTDREVTQVDATAPAPPVITGPTNGSFDRDGSFVVKGTAEPGAIVRLYEGTTRVGSDEADPESGAWSVAVVEAPEGSHSYRAKAADAAGNASEPTSALTVVVDSTKPTVLDPTSPASDATGVARRSNVVATFSEAMNPATITSSTVRLVKAGTTTAVAATVTYDAATKKVTLDPSADLARRTKYTATVTTGAKDSAGNALDQDSALTGKQAKTWSFVTGR